MFNLKFGLILVINFVLLTLATVLFMGNEKVAEVANSTLEKIETKIQSIVTVENSDADREPLFNPVAPEPLVIEKKENRQEIKRLSREKQKIARERALLQAQLDAALRQNQLLQARITNLDGELATQSSYISELQKNNHERQAKAGKEPTAILSESELLKTNIQRQPDLIVQKSMQAEDLAGQLNQQATPAEQTDNFSGSVEFGFSYEQDNKVKRDINGRLILDYEQANQYKFNSNFKFEMTEKDRSKTAEKYRWQLQADYYLEPHDLVFARTDINRSKFASYEKEDIYTVGYGRIIFDHRKHKFNMEIGPGYRMAEPNDGEDAISVDEFIVRTRFNYERAVSDSLQIIVNTVWEMGRENSIYSANFKAQNKIYRELYLIFDFEYKYTQNVPVDTLNKEVSTGLKLLYAF